MEVPVTDTAQTRADELAALPEQLPAKMGIEVVDWNRDRLVGTMPVAGNRQPYGLLHGGASAVLAETLGSIGAAMHAADHGRIAMGVELNCTHHRGVVAGLVTGVATPLHVGKTMSSFEIVITDEAGKRVCTARLTCAIRETTGAKTT